MLYIHLEYYKNFQDFYK